MQKESTTRVEKEETISELSKQVSSKKHWTILLPAIPLTVLAPLLVICTLIIVVVPVLYIIDTAAIFSTQTLGETSLSLVSSKVSLQILKTVAPVYPALEQLIESPSIQKGMIYNNYNLQNETFLERIILTRKLLKLTNVICYRVVWDIGYNSSSKVNLASVNISFVMSAMTSSGTGRDVLVKTFASKTLYTEYAVDESTQLPILSDNFTLNYTLLPSSAILRSLGAPGYTKLTKPYFIVIPIEPRRLASITHLKYMKESDPLPSFFCAGGLFVDTLWNRILAEAKPNNKSAIAMFGWNNFSTIASSASARTDSLELIETHLHENFTDQLRISIYKKFGNFSNYLKSGVVHYEDKITDNESWIITLSLINLSSYEQDAQLLVVAIPHYEIYGQIETATSTARIIAIAITVAIGILTVCIYIVIVLPMFRLAKAMTMLTNFDFSTLENSHVLDLRSSIWEIRKLQITFSTMVKAFAGAIKKNRVLASTASATSSKVRTQ